MVERWGGREWGVVERWGGRECGVGERAGGSGWAGEQRKKQMSQVRCMRSALKGAGDL